MLFKKHTDGYFMEADGGASGAGDNAAVEPDEASQPDDTTKSPDGTSDGSQNTGNADDIKSKAQRMADYIVAKRMNGLTREEIDEYKSEKEAYEAWKDERRTAAEKAAEALAAAEARQKALDERENMINAKLAAQTAGITADHVDDAVVLAMTRVSDDVTLEDAMKDIAGKNPGWMAGPNLPKGGGNPAHKADKEPEDPFLAGFDRK